MTDSSFDGLAARARDLWLESVRGLRPSPDALLGDAAAAGEMLIARVRVLTIGLLFAIQLLPGWPRDVRLVGFALTLGSFVWAVAVLVLVRSRYRAWMSLVSSLVDVSLVSAGLVGYLLVDRPHYAVNSRVLHEVYFLALAGTSLRYDWRICALSGVLAIGEYAAIASYAASHWDLNHPRYSPFFYGAFYWNTVISRLILLLLASLLSVVIVLRARRLRRLSSTDRLTGLVNRGTFDERLIQELLRARRYGRPSTVAVLDIDGFKPFNDAHGHAGGDAALRSVASVLESGLRRTDVVARYGGDEFALLLPETAGPEAWGRLEAIRDAVERMSLGTGRSGPSRITVSVGLASWPGDGEGIADVMSAADARLHQAKSAGRNRVVGPPAIAEE